MTRRDKIFLYIFIAGIIRIRGWFVGYTNGYYVADTTDVRIKIRDICLLNHTYRGSEFCSLVYDTMGADGEDKWIEVFNYINK